MRAERKDLFQGMVNTCAYILMTATQQSLGKYQGMAFLHLCVEGFCQPQQRNHCRGVGLLSFGFAPYHSNREYVRNNKKKNDSKTPMHFFFLATTHMKKLEFYQISEDK